MADTFVTIATAVKAVVDGLSLGITTSIRKQAAVQPRDTLPILLITLGTDAGEEWAVTGNGTSDLGTVGRGFSIDIDLLREVQGDITSNLTDNPDPWETIKRALNKGSLSGATTVWDTALRTNLAWEGQPFGQGGEQSHCEIHFGSAEARN